MLISVRNMELAYEWNKAIKLNYKNTRKNAVVVRRNSKHYKWHMRSQTYWSTSVRVDGAFLF
jgi:hypothetical protein